MAADLKLIYRVASAEMAKLALDGFCVKYPKHEAVANVWERSWERVIPFFGSPEEIRKIIYTTIALRHVSKKRLFVQGWSAALRQF